MKKAVSVFLTLAIILCLFPVMNFTEKSYAVDISEMKTGDIIEFGSYPQSKVTDKNITDYLDSVDKNWISYNYYLGTYDGYIQSGLADGTMSRSDFMRYADIEYNGEKYRAVVFDMYRPYDTMRHIGTFSDQKDNGYYTNTVYYFKYEPLKWRVLDPATGFVCSDCAIDCIDFNGYVYRPEGESLYYSNPDCTNYASDYSTSEIRDWLNSNFLYTAFDGNERFMIKKSLIETPSRDNDSFGCPDISDKIFLLSLSDISNTNYGFKSPYKTTDSARIMKFTDYSACQGLSCSETGYSVNWILRTPINSQRVCNVHCEGYGGNFVSTNETDYCGIVPALNLKDLTAENYQCGENAEWSFSNGELSITGTGKVDFSDEYGWELYNNDIEYIVIGNGITSLPDGIFSSLDSLSEVSLASSLQSIGKNAFTDCSSLVNVSFAGNTQIGDGAFKNSNSDLTFIFDVKNTEPEKYAKENGIKILTVSYDEKENILSFNGGIDINDSLSYNFLNEFLRANPNSEYVFFDLLKFHNIIPEQMMFFEDDEIDASIINTDLTLHNIYVSLSVLDEDGQHKISFAKMLELLESGNYDAFKLKIKSDESETEKTFFEKIAESVEEFFENALKAISKVINFITKIFKR